VTTIAGAGLPFGLDLGERWSAWLVATASESRLIRPALNAGGYHEKQALIADGDRGSLAFVGPINASAATIVISDFPTEIISVSSMGFEHIEKTIDQENNATGTAGVVSFVGDWIGHWESVCKPIFGLT
jgi:hypothetical protein